MRVAGTKEGEMKKTILTVIIFCFLGSSLLFAAEEFDFRRIRWGMTIAEVMKSERGKFIGDITDTVKKGMLPENSTVIVFSDYISGMRCQINYQFLNGMLYSSSFIIMEEHSNLDLYVDDYDKIISQLKLKYGSPMFDKVSHKSDPFEGVEGYSGLAYAQGYRQRVALFKTERSEIMAILSGDNGKIGASFFYTKKGYEGARPVVDSSL